MSALCPAAAPPAKRESPASGARAMTEADMLLRDILERGDITGPDASGRIVIELAVDRATFERLMAFGADLAEAEDGGDAEPWLVAA